MSELLYNVGAFVAAATITIMILSLIVPLFFPQVVKYLRDKEINSKTKAYSQSRKIVPILSGECSFQRAGKSIGTVYKTMSNFIDIAPSIGQKGGVEFSYTFWINMRANNIGNSFSYPLRDEGTVIFCKGIYPFNNTNSDAVSYKSAFIENATLPEKSTPEVLVKCPMVRFTPPQEGSSASPLPCLQIEFNTFKNPHNVIILDDTILSNIVSGDINPKWHLVSVVFKDHIVEREGSSEAVGLQVDVYFNDVLAKTHIVYNDGVKLNDGNLYINPSRTSDKDSTYSSLTYYNYALTETEVSNIFNKGDFKGQCYLHYGYGGDNDIVNIGPLKRKTRPVSLYRQLQDFSI